jgi:hypothetical protein
MKFNKLVSSFISLLRLNITSISLLRITYYNTLNTIYISYFYINFLSFFISLIKGLIILLKSYINY